MSSTLRTLSAGTAIILFATCHFARAEKFSRAFVSPDQAYVAVLVSEIGNGFPSSSCVDTVFVVPNRPITSDNYPSASRAYVGGCHQLKMRLIDDKQAMPNGPQLRWTAPRELNIVFDPKRARIGVPAFYSVTSLYNGAIRIRNEPE